MNQQVKYKETAPSPLVSIIVIKEILQYALSESQSTPANGLSEAIKAAINVADGEIFHRRS